MKLLRGARCSAAALAITVVIALSIIIGVSPALAHSNDAHAKRHLNWVQRHPTATSVGAAIAAHHALKVMAAHDKARGKKLNWAERHPSLTAIGAGVVVHHEIKKHTPR